MGQCTSIGNYRDNNEDRLFVDEGSFLYIVADGMGGQAAGEQASQLAVDTIPDWLANLPVESDDPEKIHQALRDAVIAANQAILSRGADDPAAQNMGTTVVMAVLRGSRAYIAHVGDSRAYILRDRSIENLTTDHNLAQALYDAKTITEDELKTHRFRHVLWKYLGSKDAVDGPDIHDLEIQAGDRILLATDGLTGAVDDDKVCDEVYKHSDPQKCAEELVRLALDEGSKDNVTCIVVHFDKA